MAKRSLRINLVTHALVAVMTFLFCAVQYQSGQDSQCLFNSITPANQPAVQPVVQPAKQPTEQEIIRQYLAMEKASSSVTCGTEVVSLPYPIWRKSNTDTVSGQCDLCALKRPMSATTIKLTHPWLMPQHQGVTWNTYVYSPQDDIYVSASLFSNNGMTSFETDVKEIMYGFVKASGLTDPLIVDVGANIGIHALMFGAAGYRTYGFEPMAETFNLLACSVAASPGIERMKVFNMGLSDREHSVCMGFDERNRGHAFVDPQAKCDKPLRFQTMDHFWETEWKREQIFLLKVDVEGFEPFVFAGAEKMLAAAPPVIIQAEITPADSVKYGKPVAPFFDMMMGLGYDIRKRSMLYQPPMQKGDATWNALTTMPAGLDEVIMIHRPSVEKLGRKLL